MSGDNNRPKYILQQMDENLINMYMFFTHLYFRIGENEGLKQLRTLDIPLWSTQHQRS